MSSSSISRDYELLFPSQAAKKHYDKFLDKLPDSDAKAIAEDVLGLKADPHPLAKKRIALRPPFSFFEGMAGYRLRTGRYRVFYDIDEIGKKVMILAIRKREKDTYNR